MRELNVLIKKCEDCPYYKYHYAARQDLCFYRESTPFALIRDGNTHIDPRCELPEAPLHVQEASILNYDVFQQLRAASNVAEVEDIPEEWLQDLDPEERERINAEEDRRISSILREKFGDLDFGD